MTGKGKEKLQKRPITEYDQEPGPSTSPGTRFQVNLERFNQLTREYQPKEPRDKWSRQRRPPRKPRGLSDRIKSAQRSPPTRLVASSRPQSPIFHMDQFTSSSTSSSFITDALKRDASSGNQDPEESKLSSLRTIFSAGSVPGSRVRRDSNEQPSSASPRPLSLSIHTDQEEVRRCLDLLWTNNRIVNDNNREQHSTSPQQQNLLNQSQEQRKKPLLTPSMPVDEDAWEKTTSSMIAYILIKELGSEFDGANVLVDVAEKAPYFAEEFYQKIRPAKLSTEQFEGIVSLTEKIDLDPRYYGQAIRRTYALFMDKSPEFTPGRPTPGMIVVFITFIVELCRRFIERGCSLEVPMVYKHTIRIMTDKSKPLSPSNWEEYHNDVIKRGNSASARALDRRSSFAVEAINTILSVWELYYNHTRS